MNKILQTITALTTQRNITLQRDIHGCAQAFLSDITGRGLLPHSGSLIGIRDAFIQFTNESAAWLSQTISRIIASSETADVQTEFSAIQDLVHRNIHNAALMCDAEINRYRPNIQNLAKTKTNTLLAKIQPIIEQYIAEIELAKGMAVKEYKSTIKYNVSGNNCRININSIDHSVNTQNADLIFDEVARAIDQHIRDQDFRTVLEVKLTEMRETVGTEKYKMTYKDFIAMAAIIPLSLLI